MTDLAALLAKLRDLESAATKGPWEVVYRGNAGHAEACIAMPTKCQIVVDHRRDFTDPAPDADFIATSRTVMGLLLDVAEAAAKSFDSNWEHEGTYASEAMIEALCRLAAAEVGP